MTRNVGNQAFTLIELLLVISIVALLGTLLLPSLGKAKESALEAKSLAYLHSHAAIFQMYTNDWKDKYPAFVVPEATVTYLRTSSGRVEAIEDYFLTCWFWPVALADAYYDGSDRQASFFPAEQTAYYGGPGGEPFNYACVFVADPNFWDPNTRLGVSQFRATGTHEVLFSSKKSLLSSNWRDPRTVQSLNDDCGLTMVMCDGSAMTKRLHSLVPAERAGDGLFPHFSDEGIWPALHTKNGVRGFDIP